MTDERRFREIRRLSDELRSRGADPSSFAPFDFGDLCHAPARGIPWPSLVVAAMFLLSYWLER